MLDPCPIYAVYVYIYKIANKNFSLNLFAISLFCARRLIIFRRNYFENIELSYTYVNEMTESTKEE